jgi:hypothetical protein
MNNKYGIGKKQTNLDRLIDELNFIRSEIDDAIIQNIYYNSDLIRINLNDGTTIKISKNETSCEFAKQ